LRRFMTAFTNARHLYLSWATAIQSMLPHPTSRRCTLILSFHLRLGLFPPQNKTYIHLYSLPHTRYMPRPSHYSDMIIQIIFGEEYR